jgi:phage terminase large subunit GpA-like protein
MKPKREPNPMWGYIELPPEEPMWKWAEENLIIPPKTGSNFPGQYRSDLAPYARDILDMIQDPDINTVVIEKGAQVGATMIMVVALGYWCKNDPGPVLFAYATEDDARSKSEVSIMPVFEESPGLRDLIPDDRKNCWTKLQYKLRKNTVNFVGSNSASKLSSRAIRYGVGDEIDKWPAKVKNEADPPSLLEQRTKTYQARRKLILLSTPTSSTGHIHRRYLPGDRRRFFLKCPHCGMPQILVWPQVKFDSKLSIDAAALNAYYQCAGCKGKINDAAKGAMLQKGRELKKTAVSIDPTMASLHLSSLYAPWVRWDQLVRKWLHAVANPEQLQDFINSELGEPFDRTDSKIEVDQLQHREGAYEEGQKWVSIPPYSGEYEKAEDGVDYQTLIWADVQKGYLEAVVRTFSKNGDSGLVWSGTLSGFAALDELAEKYGAKLTALDRRYRGEEVLEWVYQNRMNGYLVTMGVTRKGGTLFDGHALNIDEGKRTAKRGKVRQVYELSIDPDKAKEILAKCIAGDPSVPRWLIPAGYSRNRDYAEQMTAEQSVAGKWEQLGDRPNHRWDAEACLIAMAIKVGFWEWRQVKKAGGKEDDETSGT